MGSRSATGAGGSRAARYINLINTNTQSRGALFNNGDNSPRFNSCSRSKITQCQILSVWVTLGEGQRDRNTHLGIYIPSCCYSTVLWRSKCACACLSFSASQTAREVRIFTPEHWHLRQSHEDTFCSRPCTTWQSKYVLMSLGGSQQDGPRAPLLVLGLPVSSEHTDGDVHKI